MFIPYLLRIMFPLIIPSLQFVKIIIEMCLTFRIKYSVRITKSKELMLLKEAVIRYGNFKAIHGLCAKNAAFLNCKEYLSYTNLYVLKVYGIQNNCSISSGSQLLRK
jgi:hypothetical protein